MPGTSKPPTVAPDDVQRLSSALEALRRNAKTIHIARAQALVDCAFNSIDALRIQHTTSRRKDDCTQENSQYRPSARASV